MSILLDSREGSYQLACYEPLRSRMSVCTVCGGGVASACRSVLARTAAATARKKSRGASAGVAGVLHPRIAGPFASQQTAHGRRASSNAPITTTACPACRDTGRTLHTLPSGDVAFSGHGPDGDLLIGVEVKSIPDLLASLDTGRLQATQLPGMVRDYDVRYLLYYGAHRPGLGGELEVARVSAGSGGSHAGRAGGVVGRGVSWVAYAPTSRTISYSYLRAAILSLTLAGFHCESVGGHDAHTSLSEVATWLITLHDYWSKPWRDHQLLHRFDESGPRLISRAGETRDPRREQRAKTASTWPAIGYEKAFALADAYGSVREMVNAGPDSWAEVAVETTGRNGKPRRARIGRVVADALERAIG